MARATNVDTDIAVDKGARTAPPTVNEREILQRRWLKGCREILYRILIVHTVFRGERDDLEQEIARKLWRSTECFAYKAADSTWLSDTSHAEILGISSSPACAPLSRSLTGCWCFGGRGS